jgi:hypothetical protein
VSISLRRQITKSKLFYQWAIVCLCAIGTLSLLGVGYALWENGNLEIVQSISAGNIDPYFSNYELNEAGYNLGDLQITREDNIITITGNVQPGYQGTLNYEVTNRGSVPVNCCIIDENKNLPEIIKIEKPERTIRGKDGSAKGKLEIIAGEEGTYNFETKLTVHQWNAYGENE